MKHSLSHKLFSSLLALLVVVSTLSFTIEKHFCGDFLVDTAIFSETEKCSSDYVETSEKKAQNDGCCKDEIEVVKGQELLKPSDFEDFDFKQQTFIISFVFSYASLFQSDMEQSIPHKHYLPPILIKDISLFDQVFLI